MSIGSMMEDITFSPKVKMIWKPPNFRKQIQGKEP